MAKKILISSDEGCPIEVSAFFPEKKDQIKSIILLNSGLGIKKEYYHDYCVFLRNHNNVVVSYDYRGINNSKIDRINILDWAKVDMLSVINWIDFTFDSSTTKILLCHSIGSLLLGLCPKYSFFDKIIFFSPNFGFKNFFSRSNKFILSIGYLLIPLINYKLFRLLIRNLNIPINLIKDSYYLLHDDMTILERFEKNNIEYFFHLISSPILIVYFEGDQFNTLEGIKRIVGFFTNSQNRIEIISDKLVSKENIHSSFFKKKNHTLWEILSKLIENL